jgi:hypothetical protein
VRREIKSGAEGASSTVKRTSGDVELRAAAKGAGEGLTGTLGAKHLPGTRGESSAGKLGREEAEHVHAEAARDRLASASVFEAKGGVEGSAYDTGAPKPGETEGARLQLLQAAATGSADVRVGAGTVRVDERGARAAAQLTTRAVGEVERGAHAATQLTTRAVGTARTVAAASVAATVHAYDKAAGAASVAARTLSHGTARAAGAVWHYFIG